MKDPSSRAITRRDLATAISVLPFLAAPAAPQTPGAPADDLAASRQRRQAASDQLRKFRIPVATEPSFSFRP